jgi:hypothetical protein
MEHKSGLSFARALFFFNIPKLSDLVFHIFMKDPLFSGHIVDRDKSVMADEHERLLLAEAVVKPHIVFDLDLGELLPVFFDHGVIIHLENV